jgi:POT family proton-dependent oligopeptide transporter
MNAMGAAMIIMVFASMAGGNADKNIMSPAWLIGTYIMVSLAELLISPMGLSFVSKVAPPRLQGSMMGCWFGATAIGGMLSGKMGKFYSSFPHDQFFLILVGMLAVSAVLVLLFLKKLKRFSA